MIKRTIVIAFSILALGIYANKVEKKFPMSEKNSEKVIRDKTKMDKTRENDNLNSKYLVCLDPGHQLRGNSGLEEQAPGSNVKKVKVSSGTQGVTTKIPEYKLTLDIGLKVEKELLSRGYNVYMTRRVNEVNISNKERAIDTNNRGCSVYLRLHADGSSNKSMTGASVLTSSKNNKYTVKVQKSSEEFSRILLDEFVKVTGAKNRGIQYRDDLTGTNWSTVTNSLIEMGFMSNSEEDVKMSQPEYKEKMVKGIANGIDKYLRGLK